MTDFNYWQNRANDTGRVICMLCFEAKDKSQMEPTGKGNQVWDVCKACAKSEGWGTSTRIHRRLWNWLVSFVEDLRQDARDSRFYRW